MKGNEMLNEEKKTEESEEVRLQISTIYGPMWITMYRDDPDFAKHLKEIKEELNTPKPQKTMEEMEADALKMIEEFIAKNQNS